LLFPWRQEYFRERTWTRIQRVIERGASQSYRRIVHVLAIASYEKLGGDLRSQKWCTGSPAQSALRGRIQTSAKCSQICANLWNGKRLVEQRQRASPVWMSKRARAFRSHRRFSRKNDLDSRGTVTAQRPRKLLARRAWLSRGSSLCKMRAPFLLLRLPGPGPPRSLLSSRFAAHERSRNLFSPCLGRPASFPWRWVRGSTARTCCTKALGCGFLLFGASFCGDFIRGGAGSAVLQRREGRGQFLHGHRGCGTSRASFAACKPHSKALAAIALPLTQSQGVLSERHSL